LVYAASALLRDAISRDGCAKLHVDLKPEFSKERVLAEVSHPRGSRSWSSHLKSRLNLSPVHLALLHEVLSKEAMADPTQIASTIKALPLALQATRPIDEAISTAGGIKLETLTPELMANTLPGLFIAGEMLDWEAPTGGYLLSACLASGRVAGLGAAKHLLGKA
jgi:predicted flavoprotein YhiN